MSSPAIQAIWAPKSPFVPRKPEILLIGQTLVSLYPKVDSSMSHAEKVMAFQHDKTAFASTNLDQRVRILTLMGRLDLMLTTKSSLADWEQKFSCNWENFANLTILSWHNVKGSPIADTTSAGDPSVLIWSQTVKLRIAAALELNLSVSNSIWIIWDLLTLAGNAATNPVLQGEYYIQLSQGSIDLTNDRSAQYHLTTYLGADDICRLTPANVQQTILDVTHQDSPYDLFAPNFSLTLCQTDSTAVYGKLKLMVVRLASNTIHNTLFMVLVPGYLIEPHNVLDHIWQCYVDADGKTIELSAQVYFITFLNANRSFYSLKDYPINLASTFQDHINPALQKGFRSHYPLYGQTQTELAITQQCILVNMLNTLIKAENDLANIWDIV
jgi:hypothetical protein